MMIFQQQFSIVVVVIFALWNVAYALDNGVGKKPPMGWLSWQRFRCETNCNIEPDNCINEQLYMQQADKLVELGLVDAGYKYVNIDDCWSERERDSKGRLVADKQRFPHGIKFLADYMHSKGLKLGLYNDIGAQTCAGYPGMAGHFDLDAQTFAEWGVDSIKIDGCNFKGDYPQAYEKFGQSLNNTGRPILYSCSYPAYKKDVDYRFAAKICNLWRNYEDINDSWGSVQGIITYYSKNKYDFIKYNGPYHFNDPDMLIIGDFGLSPYQAEVQMGMWCMLSAPLYMSNDLRNIPSYSVALLKNKHLIAIDQDRLSISAKLISTNPEEYLPVIHYPYRPDDRQIWLKPLASASHFAVAVVNFGVDGMPTRVILTLRQLGIHDIDRLRSIFHSITARVPLLVSDAANIRYTLFDAFNGKPIEGDYGIDDKIIFRVNPSGILIYTIAPLK